MSAPTGPDLGMSAAWARAACESAERACQYALSSADVMGDPKAFEYWVQKGVHFAKRGDRWRTLSEDWRILPKLPDPCLSARAKKEEKEAREIIVRAMKAAKKT